MTLDITVAAYTMGGDFSDVGHEVRLVKAALLYADHVTLASPKATMVATIAAIVGAPKDAQQELVRQLAASWSDTRGVMAEHDRLRRLKRGSRQRDDLIKLHLIEKALRETQEQIVGRIEDLLATPSLEELAIAVDEGSLHLDAMGLAEGDWGTASMVQKATELLTDLVGPVSTSLPMFDDSASGLVRSMLKEGLIPDAFLAPATEAGLAGRYIDQLEAFPEAPMAAILEARRVLARPLVGFRSGISSLAAELDVTPLNEAFGAAADDAYRRTVAPALLELKDLAEQSKLLPALRRRLATDQAGPVVSAMIGFAATTLAHLTDIASISAAGTAALTIAGGVLQDRRGAGEAMRRNKYLWLYEAPERLTGCA